MPLHLRLATADDADAIAALFTASRNLLDFLPPIHTAEEDRGFIRGHVLATSRVTVAERAGEIAGFLSDLPGWIEHLYIAPRMLRGGIGSALLADAMARHDALELWCFAQNQRGCAFYEKHGFRDVERTDGSGNDEGAPDIRYRWERS